VDLDAAMIANEAHDRHLFLRDVMEHRRKRVAIDKRGWFLPIAVYETLQSALGTVHDGAGIVEALRAVKSPLEVEKLKRRRPMWMRACGPAFPPSGRAPPTTTWSRP